LFRSEDNLESQYGRDALRQLYMLLARGKVEGCSLERFEDATGPKLVDSNGSRDELPPITTILNRLLALSIELQNVLFAAFEQLLTARIEGAITSGTYDVGLETLRAESFVVTDRRTIYVHPATGAETRLLTITQRERNRRVSLDDALGRLSDHRAVPLINERSGRSAVQIPAPSFMLDDGEIERRVRLIRPMEQHSVPLKTMAESHWVELQLRRVRVMGAYRIELSGFNDTMRDRLRAYGLFGEIISWKLRMFVPTDASGAEILTRLLDHYPIEHIVEREAA